MKKVETAAERYRRIKAERAKNEELVDVSCPSGMVFKCRRPNVASFITSGLLPMSFASKLATAAESEGGLQSLDWQDLAKTIEFTNALVKSVCVSPKIVENPRDGQDEIGYGELELDDYGAIVKWALPGGGEAESLENFHQQ